MNLKHRELAKNRLATAISTLVMLYEKLRTVGVSGNDFYWQWRYEAQEQSPGGNI